MQAMAEQLKNSRSSARSEPAHAEPARSAKHARPAGELGQERREQLLQQLQQMMENLQMASPDDDGDDMMAKLKLLGDMIRQQQDLRDRTFRQQDQRQQDQRQQQRGQQSRPGKVKVSSKAMATGQQPGRVAPQKPTGAARPPQAIARRFEEPRPKFKFGAAWPRRRSARPRTISPRATPRARWTRARSLAQGRAVAGAAAHGAGPRADGRGGLANRAPIKIPIRSAGRCAAATTARPAA